MVAYARFARKRDYQTIIVQFSAQASLKDEVRGPPTRKSHCSVPSHLHTVESLHVGLEGEAGPHGKGAFI